MDDAGGWKIGPGNKRVHLFESRGRVIDKVHHRIAHLCEIVRRHIGGHADGNTAGAVDEKIRNFAWKIGRFFAVFVVIRNEVDGFFLDVFEQGFGKRIHARFGVSHGRCRIAVD